MLYIFAKPHPREPESGPYYGWHVGESLPSYVDKNLGRMARIEADGDELEWLLNKLRGG